MSSLNMVMHTTGDPTLVINEARRDLRDLDPDLAMSRIMTLDDMVATAVAQPRFYMALLAGFAALALVLCAIGIYGVIAYLVGQRAREIGIRIALGATASRVVTMFVKDGALMVGAGLVIGVGGALALTRLMTSLLFNTTPTDMATYLGVVAVLGVVALAASGIPAIRAAQVDPALTMRGD
jgi:ABC-type antimicrobial peptide transport system permease subunit